MLVLFTFSICVIIQSTSALLSNIQPKLFRSHLNPYFRKFSDVKNSDSIEKSFKVHNKVLDVAGTEKETDVDILINSLRYPASRIQVSK